MCDSNNTLDSFLKAVGLSVLVIAVVYGISTLKLWVRMPKAVLSDGEACEDDFSDEL